MTGQAVLTYGSSGLYLGFGRIELEDEKPRSTSRSLKLTHGVHLKGSGLWKLELAVSAHLQSMLMCACHIEWKFTLLG